MESLFALKYSWVFQSELFSLGVWRWPSCLLLCSRSDGGFPWYFYRSIRLLRVFLWPPLMSRFSWKLPWKEYYRQYNTCCQYVLLGDMFGMYGCLQANVSLYVSLWYWSIGSIRSYRDIWQEIRVNTVDRWGHAETWGTDNPTYPSRNVEDEETLGKRTDVRGNRSNRNPVLGDLEHEPGVCLIRMTR